MSELKWDLSFYKYNWNKKLFHKFLMLASWNYVKYIVKKYSYEYVLYTYMQFHIVMFL